MMETTTKLHPGQQVAPLTFKRLDGTEYQFGGTGAWQALIVYRGQHCPICTGYLGKIKQRFDAFEKLGVHVAAISADHEAQARITFDKVHPNFPLLYGLDDAMMRALGLYISTPRAASETDHNFPEPGLLSLIRMERCRLLIFLTLPLPDLIWMYCWAASNS